MIRYVTPERLLSIWQCPVSRAEKWAGPINTTLNAYQITNMLRIAAFLAQTGHESGRGIYVKEMWGPSAVQKRYEGRVDLGNTDPGDGLRFRGRGLLQITGRANYRACGQALGVDLEEAPEMLELPEMAAMSAGWYWQEKSLNDLADREEFRLITRRINGGYNGIAERESIYAVAKTVLSCITI